MKIISRSALAFAALLCVHVVEAGAAEVPLHQAGPDVSKGGFSLTAAACDETISEFTARGCTLSAPVVGVVEVRSDASDNYLDLFSPEATATPFTSWDKQSPR